MTPIEHRVPLTRADFTSYSAWREYLNELAALIFMQFEQASHAKSCIDVTRADLPQYSLNQPAKGS